LSSSTSIAILCQQTLCILKPLTDQLKENLKLTAAILWTSSMQSAFEKAKTSLAESVRLIHPSPGAKISLIVDASAEHIGAALQQRPHPAAP
jgi:hypothetical protein